MFTLDMLDEMEPWRVLVYGDYGAGKTSMALSVMDWQIARGKKPEEVYVAILDNDGGLLPLIHKAAIPREYRARMKCAINTDWKALVTRTEEFIGEAQNHARKHGADTAWIIVDNMLKEWQWARDHTATKVYGVHEYELALQKRQAAIEAGKANLPTFSHKFDWGPINALHDAYMSKFVLSGVSYMFLSPEKKGKEDWDDDNSATVITPSGQKGLRGTVDEVLRLRVEAGEYYADLEKTRKSPKRFRGMPAPTFGKFVDYVEKARSGDAQKKG